MGTSTPRVCNKQRSALFIFGKWPFFLKEKVPSKRRSLPSKFECSTSLVFARLFLTFQSYVVGGFTRIILRKHYR